MTSQTSDGETIGNRERSRAIARREPGRNRSSHLPQAGSTLARWAQVSIPGPVYGRPSARQEAHVEAIGRGEPRVHSTRGNRVSWIANRVRRDANGDASAILRWGRKDRGPCLGYISHWRIRITGKWSRFVMTFVVSSVYFDISLGRGEHRSMKYERVPRDFHDGFLTSVLIQL